MLILFSVPVVFGVIFLGAFNQSVRFQQPFSPPPMSCSSIMKALYEYNTTTQWPPLCPLTKVADPLAESFLLNGLSESKTLCFAQRYEGAHVMDWSYDFIESYCAMISESGSGSYSRDIVLELKLTLQSLILDKEGEQLGVSGAVGLVMGTENPWVECLLLNEGASLIWTFEYATINVQHPRMRAKQCKLIARDYLADQFDPVDIIIAFSSLEHSGLGRYGDSLNPDGDKEALEQAWCMLRPGGLLVLGLPMTCTNEGELVFNAHRIYGFDRLAYITKNFELVRFVSDSCYKANVHERDQAVILRKPILFDSYIKNLEANDFERAILNFF